MLVGLALVRGSASNQPTVHMHVVVGHYLLLLLHVAFDEEPCILY